jgi:hypothetical protein
LGLVLATAEDPVQGMASGSGQKESDVGVVFLLTGRCTAGRYAVIYKGKEKGKRQTANGKRQTANGRSLYLEKIEFSTFFSCTYIYIREQYSKQGNYCSEIPGFNTENICFWQPRRVVQACCFAPAF